MKFKKVKTDTSSQDFGLTERDLATLEQVFRQYPEITTVALFGSRAMHTHSSGSDIDLAVLNAGVAHTILLRIKAAFSDSSLPYFVDVVDFTTLENEALKEHILRVGKVIYAKSPENTPGN